MFFFVILILALEYEHILTAHLKSKCTANFTPQTNVFNGFMHIYALQH